MKTPAFKTCDDQGERGCSCKTIMVREQFVNLDSGSRFGDTGWQERFADDLGDLYRAARRAHGRCTSKVYRDGQDGQAVPVGWTFVKRVAYESSYRPNPETYLQEVWVTYKEVR
jgi:hypothetical protein